MMFVGGLISIYIPHFRVFIQGDFNTLVFPERCSKDVCFFPKDVLKDVKIPEDYPKDVQFTHKKSSFYTL